MNLEQVREYVPKEVRSGKTTTLVEGPEELLPRFHEVADDGHTVKLARALLLAQRITRPYLERKERPEWLRIVDDQTWLKAHYILLDASENQPEERHWVRDIGFDDAWNNIPRDA